jgi:polysaccharide export outer membrane protein
VQSSVCLACVVVFGVCLATQAEADQAPFSNSETSVVYLLGPGDEVTVRVLDLDEIQERPFRIDESGLLHLPVLGDFPAAGSSTSELASRIRVSAFRFLKDPSVTVNLSSYRDQTVTILGAVNSPGEKQIRGDKSLLDIVSQAGGFRTDAGSVIQITRPVSSGPIPSANAHPDSTGRFTVATVNIGAAMKAENPGENIPLRVHDIVTVPRAETVFVIGEVLRPGAYEIGEARKISVLDALSRAGGANRSANSSRLRILRSVAGKAERTETVLDLNRILAGKIPDFVLEPQDILYLPTNKAKLATTRALETLIGTGSSIAVFRSSR